MAKRLPTQVTGKPHWQVKVVPRLRYRHKGKLRDYWGLCDYTHRTITISKRCEQFGITRDTFLHEVIHKVCPFLAEDAVELLATELDDALNVMDL